ncbi:MAG: hypothetical protein WKF57_06675 [Nakamurella sp.]
MSTIYAVTAQESGGRWLVQVPLLGQEAIAPDRESVMALAADLIVQRTGLDRADLELDVEWLT